MPRARAKRLLIGFGAAALLAGAPLSQALAATATATFTVTADVTTTCDIDAQNMDFGTYSGVAKTTTTTLTALCSSGTPYTIGLNAGTSAGATVTTRKMTGPAGQLLGYGLFRDAAHTQNWGNTIGTDTQSGTGTGAEQIFTVFGDLPASQFVGAGSYADTITATLTF